MATTGANTTTTTYYYAAGQRIALAMNGPSGNTLSYLASDLLGSASVALNGSGTPTASQLYAPYGGMRYQNGAMPTDYGFTGQRNDATTGLYYYGARYYDPTIGQFTSTDTALAGGLNRYGYVGDNPINRTDPSGHMSEEREAGGGIGGIGDGGESTDNLESPLGGSDADISPDMSTVTNSDGSTETFQLSSDDMRADTQEVRQDELDMRQNERPQEPQEPQEPEKPSNPTNTSQNPSNPETPNTPQTPSQPGNPSNIGTAVSSTPSGVTVTTGSQTGSGPFFQSTLSSDGTEFSMQQAYRNGFQDHASDEFARQFELAGGDPAQLQQLTLENVQNEQTLEQWDEWDSLAGSTLDKMAKNFANTIGVQLGTPSWSGQNIVYPILP